MNPTERFSTRVTDYVRYRPTYLPAVFEALARDAGWRPNHTVADIGAGTGIFTQLLLERGNTVYAVEPNDSMRAAAEKLLGSDPRFHPTPGTAEATTLPGASVDGITAAQAFHWFDRNKARAEFLRILRPGGWLALVWNERIIDATPFQRAYEEVLIELSIDYAAVKERDLCDADVSAFFAPAIGHKSEFENSQSFDFEGALGRLMSSSYAPQPGHPKHEPIVAAMRRIFDANQRDGLVRFDYRTVVYAGCLA
jgi:ubiquinone/menaquinone biosynthesis C-methylase UbiE